MDYGSLQSTAEIALMNPSPDFWPETTLRRSEVEFHFRGNDHLGYLVAPPESIGPRPLVLVIHNYQGLKFFDIHVAEYLARLGYVGLAIDMYGNDVLESERIWPNSPEDIESFQKKCFQAMVALDHDHEFFRAQLQAWLDVGLDHPTVDSQYSPAVIGYCFGGMAAIECVRGGLNVGGIVSFHGLLQTGEDPNPAVFGAVRPKLKPHPNKYNTKAVVLIENGADDHLVSDASQQRFFEEMDLAGVDWNFHHHAKTPHGFALPPSLGPPGKLHETADRRSTMNMLSLFREIFPGVAQNPVSYNASGTSIPA
jgi:dienelactone hydrolase